jgi:ATP-binding cassette subfamily B protein
LGALATGRLALPAAAAAILAVRFVSSSLNQLFRSIGSLFESAAFLSDLEDFVTGRHQLDQAAPAIPPLQDRIRIEQVGFRYPGAAVAALADVELEIGAGEIVALVGENGSGKTTLAKLIAGLYQPTAGRIVWDGVDTSELDPTAVRRQISVIFQDFVHYQLSALDNIGLGDPDHAEDLAAARAAAERAGALEYLEQLPNGLSTVLSKEYTGGQDLSGGQWQRVALARALRKPSSLVVLDEPTASLDPKSEARLFDDIRSTLQGRAGLLISHRFSSVRLADRIYVLERGRVIETGRHDELVAQGGRYAELFRLQAAAYR